MVKQRLSEIRVTATHEDGRVVTYVYTPDPASPFGMTAELVSETKEPEHWEPSPRLDLPVTRSVIIKGCA